MADPEKPTINVRIGGATWAADENNARALKQAGGKFISPQEAQHSSEAVRDLSYVDENWGTAGKLGMGLASGLTLGMGPQRAAGQGFIDPGHLGAAQESGAYLAGDVAGTALPALFSGGESVLGRGLSMTPAGLMTGLGSTSERFAAGLFGEYAWINFPAS